MTRRPISEISVFQQVKPALPRRYLMALAGAVWIATGTLLASRGLGFWEGVEEYHWIQIPAAIILGLLFHFFIFSRTSSLYIRRIQSISVEYPCFFSFFSFKAYLVMLFMMGFGSALRSWGWLPLYCLAPIYLGVGIPLFFAGFKFLIGFYIWYNP